MEHVRNGERERERGRGSDTHAGGTTHVGPVICWTPHGHVVFHGHGVHSIVHFLALSRGVSYLHHGPVQLYGPGGLRATRIDIDIQRRASDVNYIEKESKRRWEGEREREGERVRESGSSRVSGKGRSSIGCNWRVRYTSGKGLMNGSVGRA